MDPNALAIDEERAFSAAVSMAAAHDAQLERLCGPPSAFPHLSDSVCSVGGLSIGREDRVDAVRQYGSALVLLAAAAISRALRVYLADRAAGLFGAVFVSHEHGQSTAVRHSLPRHRDSPVFQTEILALAAPRS